jgi:protein involved in polysaccharide export with SLBB domain
VALICSLPALGQDTTLPDVLTPDYENQDLNQPGLTTPMNLGTALTSGTAGASAAQSVGVGSLGLRQFAPGSTASSEACSALNPMGSMTMAMGTTALPAETILSIFDEQPDLLPIIKAAVLDDIKRRAAAASSDTAAGAASMSDVATTPDEWENTDPDEVTDDAFYSRIEQDSDFRAVVTYELRQRGYAGPGGTGMDMASSGMDTGEWGPGEAPGGMNQPAMRPGDAALSAAKVDMNPGARTAQPNYGRREARPPREEEANAPKMLHRPSPYPTLPSSRDLYSQYPSREVPLKRFGMDVFRPGGAASGVSSAEGQLGTSRSASGVTSPATMDLPAGPDYVLGPGDAVIVSTWGGTSQRLNRVVDREGQLLLPEIGPVVVAGRTMQQAQDAIQSALGSQFKNIQVGVSLARVRTVRIYVVGDVQRPGAYDVSSLSTPLNALNAAGGPTRRGSLRAVRVYRGKQLVREVDLYDFLLHGIRSEVDRLLPGDTILVPPVGPQVTVTGMVRRPAIYEVKGESAMNEVLDLAGGVLVEAALGEIKVERVEPHLRRTSFSVLLPHNGDGAGDAAALAAFHVQDGDRVIVSPILPYNEKIVYLQGHVFRPGRYPYRDGMTAADLLRSYQDVMPEPAEHAEVIRLQPPDFRPYSISFNLPDVLRGAEPIVLEPYDVIRIFGRYEIDPPKVTIQGEVLRPGKYPMAEGMTAVALTRMAGGFKRSAYRDYADLASYEIKEGHMVETDHRVVEIGKALEGDKAADVALKPGDVLSIHQLPGWKDIGAAVMLKGEVMYPGSYGIEIGERLSSVLKRAGGFRSSAYPAGAVLERVQVKEMAEKTRVEMIRRLETMGPVVKGVATTATEQMALAQGAQAQQQQMLASLRSHPASGRLVIHISADISQWENTPADMEMRAGDRLVIPKRPNFVLVSGQVYNPTAITFLPGKSAGYYLRQAGGPTDMANKKEIFVVRANGSVVGRGNGGIWKESVLALRLQPGDSVVVPDKLIGASAFWRNFAAIAQVMSALSVAGAVLSAQL